MAQISKLPNLVASTKDAYCSSIAESHARENKLKDVPPQVESSIELANEQDLEANYFKSAQWHVSNLYQ